MNSEYETVVVRGKKFALVPTSELSRLRRLEKRNVNPTTLPPFPKADQQGSVPAKAYILASIARGVIKERLELGLTQDRLAKLAGVRADTLARLESATHSAATATVEKIERALQSERRRQSRRTSRAAMATRARS